MASGSSGRPNSASKAFDFASDDILCSYEDYGNQDSSNGSHSDPGLVHSCGKDFHKSRLARPIYAAPAYSQPEDSINQDVVAIVDKSMKKYADNLMRFLEGISYRLSQLELYCYNLDKSIGGMRSELNRDHGDADAKLKSLEKNLQEVHRSVQILRDKQELAETQKELAKLQLTQKESSSGGASHSSEERAPTPAPETKKTDNASDASNQQLALALPHQVAPPQPQQVPLPSQAPPSPPQNASQQRAYYLAPAHLQNPAGPTQIHYVTTDSQGRPVQLQEISRVQPPSSQPQVAQIPNMQPIPQYQQQWSQQIPQQVPAQPPPQQPSSMPPQMRAQPTQAYPPYPPLAQPVSTPPPPPPQETIPSSMPVQIQYSGVPPPVSSHAETVPYGYGSSSRIIQQQTPLPPPKGAFGPRPGDGYAASGPQAPFPPGSGYMVYEADGGRAHHQPQPPQQGHFSQGMYPPPNVQTPNPHGNPSGNHMARNPSQPQFVRNHPYSELVDKLVSMGFRGDHVVSVIQRMEESGQPVDFNSVLDRLNVGSQRGWSG